MRIEKAGGNEFEFWNSIEELPMERYMQFQAMALQDAGIGSTLDDYDRHEQTIDVFLAEGRTEDAIKERENKRFNIYSIISKANTKSLCLACLCRRINKDVRYDFSAEGLAATSELINKSGFTAGQVHSLLDELKKKSKQS